MKEHKLKAALYILVFFATAVITYMHKNGTLVLEEKTDTMAAAGLPILYMQSEGGIKYNYLHGYVSEVDTALLHDCVTPVSSDYKLTVYIDNYNMVVSGVEYEVSAIDTGEVVDSSLATSYYYNAGGYAADFEFATTLRNSVEYMMKITVSTEENDSVDYYTRIVITNGAQIDKKLEYVTFFSECALDDNRLTEIASKMETDSTGVNTNLGRVNIHSRLSQVGFGNLDVTRTSDRYFYINEIDGTRASITIEYKARSGEGTYIEYNIKEFLRIYQPDDTVTYVYNYDRFMNQIFDAENAITDDGELYFGISSDDTVNMKASEKGKITVFERDGSLWKYDATANKVTAIFSFEDETTDGVREEFAEHSYKIFEVSDTGDVSFLVYGYMNRGSHEGELGMSVCRYIAKENLTEEILFIPRTVTYESMEEDINTLAYINDNNVMFIYYNNTVYYYDITTKESMITASDVDDSSCYFSEDNKLFAYQNGTDINLLKLDTGEIYIITAEEGTRLTSVGFIDENYIYGVVPESMITRDFLGNEIAPMNKIIIMAKDYTTVREYETEGVYITSARVEENQLVLERASIDSNGVYTSLTDDRILSSLNNTKSELEIVTASTEIRQRELYVKLLSAGVTNVSNDRCVYKFYSNTTVYAGENTNATRQNYYVYVYGELNQICDTAANAIATAYTTGGVVTDYIGNTIWTRYRDRSNTLGIQDNEIVVNADTKAAATDLLLHEFGVDTSSDELYNKEYSITKCIEELTGNVTDLTGCTVEQMTYFVGDGKPVITVAGENVFELVYGYDSTNIHVINFTEGIRKSYTIEEFETLTERYGKIFITY